MENRDHKELNRLRARREELKSKEEKIVKRMEAARERGDDESFERENIRLTTATMAITRLNDDIFALEKALGVDPEEMGASGETQ